MTRSASALASYALPTELWSAPEAVLSGSVTCSPKVAPRWRRPPGPVARGSTWVTCSSDGPSTGGRSGAADGVRRRARGRRRRCLRQPVAPTVAPRAVGRRARRGVRDRAHLWHLALG